MELTLLAPGSGAGRGQKELQDVNEAEGFWKTEVTLEGTDTRSTRPHEEPESYGDSGSCCQMFQ